MTDFARTLPPEDMDCMLRTLSRRPSGRSAILNSPTVVRALTQSKREVSQTWRFKRGKELSQLAAKVSQSKGCVTKCSIKLRRAEARAKGLQTMLTKVVCANTYTQQFIYHSRTSEHSLAIAHAHIITQVRQDTKANSEVVKQRTREVNQLNRQVQREQYLRKKGTRATEDVTDVAAADARLFTKQLEGKDEHIHNLERQVAELKLNNKKLAGELDVERNKAKCDALAEHRKDIRRLQQKKMDLKESVEGWQERCDLLLINIYMHIHLFL